MSTAIATRIYTWQYNQFGGTNGSSFLVIRPDGIECAYLDGGQGRAFEAAVMLVDDDPAAIIAICARYDADATRLHTEDSPYTQTDAAGDSVTVLYDPEADAYWGISSIGNGDMHATFIGALSDALDANVDIRSSSRAGSYSIY